MRQVASLVWLLLGLLWAQNAHYTLQRHFFVGTPAHETPLAALLTPDRRLIIAGEYQETPQMLPDGWIACVSAEGEILWQIRPGGLGPDRIYDLALADSILYFCGITGSALTHPEEMPPSHRADFWVGAVHVETGALLWQRRWGSPYPDFAYTLTLSPYHTLLVGGATWEDTTIGLQPVLFVLNARSGEVLQRRLFGQPGHIKRLRFAKNGLYAAIGEIQNYPVILAVDDILQVLWRISLRQHPFPSRLEALLILGNGLWLVGGQYEGQWGLSAIAPEGRVLWEKTWSLPAATGTLLSLAEDPNQHIWAAGYIQSERIEHPEYRGQKDIWLSLLSPHGRLLWERALGGPYPEKAIAILPTPTSTFLVAQKENRFTEAPVHADAWVALLRGEPCDSLPIVLRHDVPSGKEKAGRSIRFWVELPSHLKPTRIVWHFSDGTSAEGSPVERIFGMPGTYEVSATLSLPYGCPEVVIGPTFLKITRP
ncbi:MAG: PKD domain-containing protein [Bacteroidota bacterium]|nr:PKD domain-containing protein [Bacteroidota bacterium]